jgi:exosome complex RNA-binding protein Csl4
MIEKKTEEKKVFNTRIEDVIISCRRCRKEFVYEGKAVYSTNCRFCNKRIDLRCYEW